MRFIIALLLPTTVLARYGFPYQCGSGSVRITCVTPYLLLPLFVFMTLTHDDAYPAV